MTIQQHDIVIVGGGVVGLTFAAAMLSACQNIAIIDAAPVRKNDAKQPEIDPRVSALSPHSQKTLEAVGAWSHIENARLAPYTKMRVWDALQKGEIAFDSRTWGLPSLGHIVENRVTIAALEKVLADSHAVTWYRGISPEWADNHQQGVSITLSSGQQLNTTLLVGADGARSWVRSRFFSKPVIESYGQGALVSHIQLEKGHEATAWQVFLARGPLAVLPLWEKDLASIVWSGPLGFVEQLKQAASSQLSFRLQSALGDRFGRIKVVAPAFAFPLNEMHVKEYAKPSVVLMGDAAHTIHPLAGQGVNLGIQDAKVLSDMLRHHLQRYRPLNDFSCLQAFSRQQRFTNRKMLLGVAAIKKCFEAPKTKLRRIASFGFSMVNQQNLLKHWCLMQAGGG